MTTAMKSLHIVIATSFLLLGCSPEEKEAKELGFSSVAEMRDIQQKGWHTKARYNEDLAKKRGFSSLSEMLAADEDEKQRLAAQLEAEKTELTRPWSNNLEYHYYSDGSCTPKNGTVCMSPRLFERACKEAASVSKYAISLKAINAYGDEKILLEGGSMVGKDISYGQNSRGQMVCTVRITMEGIVHGNSSRKEISGNASSFATDSNGRLLVRYFGY